MTQSLLRVLVSLVVSASVAVSLAQYDANPQNPANWQILTTTETGADNAERAEYEWDPSTGTYIRVTAHYSRVWGSNHWVRNGVSLPSGLELPVPFSKVTPFGELDALYYDSQGSVTMKALWISPYPAPAQARFSVHSSANIYKQGVGSYTLDNGLNSPEIIDLQDPVGYTLYAWKNAPELRTLPVSNGEVVLTLGKHARASAAGLFAVGVQASAHGGSLVLDSRNVLILAAGGPVYKPVPTPAARPEVWSASYTEPGPNGEKVVKTYNYRYDKVNRVPIELTYTGNNANSASWTLGLNIYEQLIVSVDGNYSVHPETIPKTDFTFFGAAASQGIEGERYEWSGASGERSRTLPYGNEGYTIENYLESHDSTVKVTKEDTKTLPWPPKTTKTSWLEEHNDSSTLTLTYTWTDGLIGTSERSIQYVPPVERKGQGDPFIDWKMDDSPEAIPFEDGGSSMDSYEVAVYRPATWNKKAVTTVASAVGALSGTLADTYSAASIPAGIVAGVAAFVGMVAEFTPDGSEKDQIQRSGYTDAGNTAFWYYDPDGNGPLGSAWFSTPPLHWVIGEWQWYVKGRPKHKITPELKWKWGPNGYERQGIVPYDQEQSMKAAPKFYYFEYNGGYGGGTGGGTGGGGGNDS